MKEKKKKKLSLEEWSLLVWGGLFLFMLVFGIADTMVGLIH